MTFSLIPAVAPKRMLLLNRKLVGRALDMGHISPAAGAVALVYVFQLERELAAGLIEPDYAVRQASEFCRVTCTTHPDRTAAA